VTRVLIGASSATARARLETALARNTRFQVVGSFAPHEALSHLEEFQPDLVLLDLGALTDEAMSVVLEFPGERLSSTVVILTDDDEKFLTAGALRSGVRAILPRAAGPEEIFAAIQASLAGLVVLQLDTLDALLFSRDEAEPSEPGSAGQILTPRELEVLRIIAEGRGNKEIASELRITDHTVKFHISSILAKLGASNRAEAVTLGIRLGLIMV
jgi:NarL family two-component system response regulator YdfI